MDVEVKTGGLRPADRVDPGKFVSMAQYRRFVREIGRLPDEKAGRIIRRHGLEKRP